MGSKLACCLSNIKLGYDRAISSSSYKQLVFLFAVITVFFFFLFGVSLMVSWPASDIPENSIVEQSAPVEPADDFNTSMNNRLLGIFSHFVDPGNVHMATRGNKGFAAFIALIGIIFFNGMLISTLSNMVERRVDRINAGKVRYRLKDHVIIFGFEEYLAGTIKEKVANNPKQKIVIQTNEHPNELRKKLNVLLTGSERLKIIFYQCNRDSADDIRKMQPELANSVYIVGEQGDWERDNKNINCFKIIETQILLKSKTQSTLGEIKTKPVYLFINDSTIFNIVKDYDIRDKKLIDFRLLNYYEEWSKKLFVNPETIQLENVNSKIAGIPASLFHAKSEKRLEIVLAGFNRMGRSIIENAIRYLHFPNESITKITIIDKGGEQLLDRFKNSYPGFDSLYDFEFNFIEDDFFADSVKEYIESLYTQADIVPYFIIAFGNTSEGLKAGLNLPKIVYSNSQETIVWIRQEMVEGADIIKSIPVQQDDKSSIRARFKNVHFFGMLNQELLTSDQFDSRESHASSAEKTYSKITKGEQQKELSGYGSRPELFRWSNRYLVDSYVLKLAGLQYFVTSQKYNVDIYEEVEAVTNTDVVEAMAKAEHARYVGERVMSGWSKGEEKDVVFKLHNCIVDWQTLITDKKLEKFPEYDRKFIRNMISHLNCSELSVVRKRENKKNNAQEKA